MKKAYIQPTVTIVRAASTCGPLMTSRFGEVGDQKNGGTNGEVLDGNDYTGQQRSKENVWDSWDD